MSTVVPLNFHADQVNKNVELVEKLLADLAENKVVSLALRYENTEGQQEGLLIVPLGGRLGHTRRLILMGHLQEMTAALCNVDDDEEE